MYRMATSADVKPPKGQKFSRYLWKMPVKKVRIPLHSQWIPYSAWNMPSQSH